MEELVYSLIVRARAEGLDELREMDRLLKGMGASGSGGGGGMVERAVSGNQRVVQSIDATEKALMKMDRAVFVLEGRWIRYGERVAGINDRAARSLESYAQRQIKLQDDVANAATRAAERASAALQSANAKSLASYERTAQAEIAAIHRVQAAQDQAAARQATWMGGANARHAAGYRAAGLGKGSLLTGNDKAMLDQELASQFPGMFGRNPTLLKDYAAAEKGAIAAAAGADKLAQSMRGLGAGLSAVDPRMATFVWRMSYLTDIAPKAAGPLIGVAAAIGSIAAAAKAAASGDALQKLDESFAKLTGGQHNAMVAIDRYKAASHGQFTSAQLQGMTALPTARGLDPARLAEAMELVRTTSIRSGQDFSQNWEQYVNAVLRKEMELVDQLGVDWHELDYTMMSSAQLNEESISQMRENVRKMGGDVHLAGEDWKGLGVHIKESWNMALKDWSNTNLAQWLNNLPGTLELAGRGWDAFWDRATRSGVERTTGRPTGVTAKSVAINGASYMFNLEAWRDASADAARVIAANPKQDYEVLLESAYRQRLSDRGFSSARVEASSPTPPRAPESETINAYSVQEYANKFDFVYNGEQVFTKGGDVAYDKAGKPLTVSGARANGLSLGRVDDSQLRSLQMLHGKAPGKGGGGGKSHAEKFVTYTGWDDGLHDIGRGSINMDVFNQTGKVFRYSDHGALGYGAGADAGMLESWWPDERKAAWEGANISQDKLNDAYARHYKATGYTGGKAPAYRPPRVDQGIDYSDRSTVLFRDKSGKWQVPAGEGPWHAMKQGVANMRNSEDEKVRAKGRIYAGRQMWGEGLTTVASGYQQGGVGGAVSGAASFGIGAAMANLSATAAAGPVGIGLMIASAVVPGLLGDLFKEKKKEKQEILDVRIREIDRSLSLQVARDFFGMIQGSNFSAANSGARMLSAGGA